MVVPTPSEVAHRLCTICAEILELARVSTTDSFVDVGGDSIAGMMLVAALEEEFGVEIEIAAIFEARNLGELADSLYHLSTGSGGRL